MIGSDIDIDAPVHSLGVAQQQIVEIAKRYRRTRAFW